MLSELGWDEGWATALGDVPRAGELVPARVTAVHRGRVQVVGEEVDALAPAGGSLEGTPVVGDWVGFDGTRIRVILPRRTALAREGSALAANVDLGLVFASSGEDPNLRRLERFVAMVTEGGIEPLVIMTKSDLSDDAVGASDLIREQLGVELIVISSRDGRGIEAIRERLRPRSTAALLGPSGVGKSTMLNTLLGDERQRTLPVRDHDGAGRHATVHRELFAMPNGALIIDAPGVRRPGWPAPRASPTRSPRSPGSRNRAGSPTAGTRTSPDARFAGPSARSASSRCGSCSARAPTPPRSEPPATMARRGTCGRAAAAAARSEYRNGPAAEAAGPC